MDLHQTRENCTENQDREIQDFGFKNESMEKYYAGVMKFDIYMKEKIAIIKSHIQNKEFEKLCVVLRMDGLDNNPKEPAQKEPGANMKTEEPGAQVDTEGPGAKVKTEEPAQKEPGTKVKTEEPGANVKTEEPAQKEPGTKVKTEEPGAQVDTEGPGAK